MGGEQGEQVEQVELEQEQNQIWQNVWIWDGVGGTDIGRTGVRSSGEGRGIVDDADNRDWVPMVEIEEMESTFTLPPSENPLQYCLNHHH